MVKKLSIKVSSRVRDISVQCLSAAVGDRIKEDVRRNGLQTHLGDSGRIWDFLIDELHHSFESPDCKTYIVKRTRQMACVYDRESRCFFTFMREDRFAEIQRQRPKRRRMHYLEMLAHYFNADLQAPFGQTSLFEKEFDNQSDMHRVVDKMLWALRQDDATMERHVLVLFSSEDYQLTSVRAVMLDKNLDIAAEENWSGSIDISESVVVEAVENVAASTNDPNHGLQLTGKAIARKKKNFQVKEEKKDVPMS